DVYGVDLTYGTSDETGISGWTFGGEWLTSRGDLNAQVDDMGTPLNFADDTLSVLHGNRSGYYVWGEHAFNKFHSAGLLYSEFEQAAAGAPSDSELVAYYTRNLTEFSRLRFGVSYADPEDGNDSTAFLVQFTNFFGSHAHGVNW
ncbi:MAG TPA: hypothetical protein P5218_08015, partial [Planctomycetota bacterium]|nr:hypothetical protein [Planctomycetota bacterium]